MANLGNTFDPNAVPPADDFDLIPNGTIAPAHITDSDVKPTKDGRGTLVELEWQILDGPYRGRKIWERVNIKNPSAKAQDIGQRHFSAICHATGAGAISDTTPLHNKPVIVKVGIEKGNDGYQDKNKIAAVKPIGQGATPQQAPQTPAQPPQASWSGQGQAPARPAQPQPGGTPWGNQQGNRPPF